MSATSRIGAQVGTGDAAGDGTGAEPTPAEPRATFRLRAAELKVLAVRSDRAGALRALGHFGAIALVGAALWLSLGSARAVPLAVLQGYLIAFLFTALHECAHQTAFATRGANLAVGHLSAFAIGLPYEHYRLFHWDHHRYTHDPARDPELAVPPPTRPLAMAWYLTGLPSWAARATMLCRHAVLGRVTAPWFAPERHGAIVREARLYLLGYAAVAAVSVATGSMLALWLWMVPLMLGQPFLRPYLLAEHTGCDHVTDMLANTRTTYSNAFVRFFAWNMPYHVAHHAYPAVPFHRLAELDRRLAPHALHTARGYPAAVSDAIRHATRRMPSQS